MLVIQYNYSWGYKNIVALLEIAINIGINIICLQKLFIGNKSITYSAFNFYWLEKSRTKTCILIQMKKELTNKIIVENRVDLVDLFYFLSLDI